MTGRRVLVPLLIAAIAGLFPAGGCALEARYYHPRTRDFPTPAGIEDLRFTAADGAGLHAWFIPAPSLAAGRVERAPVVIFCSGNASQIDFVEPRIRVLSEKGDLSLLLLSYRGYGRSDPCANLSRRATVLDAEAALDAALARPDVDPACVVMMGYSIGGPPALAVAAKRPDVLAAVVGGTFAHAEMALEDLGHGWASWLIGGAYDPADSAAKLGDRPLMVFHGEKDDIVAPYHALLIAARAIRAGTPVKLVMIDGADHMDVLEKRPALFDDVAAFIRSARGEAGAPASGVGAAGAAPRGAGEQRSN